MGNRNTRNQRRALVFRNENFQQRNAQQRNLQQRNASSESSSDNSSNKSDSSSETASNTTRTRTRNKDVETKKHEVNCSACLDKLDVSHGGISCNQNHHLCLEACAKDYVNTKIADGMEGVPLTCPVCKLAIKENIIQRVMTEEQLEQYTRLVVLKSSLENPDDCDAIVYCPSCNYYEYRNATSGDIMFVYCQDPNCMKVSCYTCKSTISSHVISGLECVHENFGTRNRRRSNQSDSEDSSFEPYLIDNEAIDGEFERHFKCNSLRALKHEFDSVIQKGQGDECPKCHLIGNKNPGDCCHMTCPQCETEWCYICGKSQEELGIGDFYSHFTDPDSDNAETGCYMYLTELYEAGRIVVTIDDIDTDEDTIDSAITDEYHRRRTLFLLKKFHEKHGSDAFNELMEQFPAVENCGYSLQEIENAQEI
uniref:RING-type domain-containing protein n=1 Tax=Acrobeloides nanus TaxID=290746 RepID=A0A914EMI6_9BILA